MSVSTQEAVGRVLAIYSQHGLADNDLGRREVRCVAPPVEGGSIAGALVLAHGGGNGGHRADICVRRRRVVEVAKAATWPHRARIINMLEREVR